MTWYSNHVQPHVNRAVKLQHHANRAIVSYVKPEKSRRSWLVGSSLLLLVVPVSAYALLAHSDKVNQNAESVLSTADQLSQQAVDLSIANSVGSFGQGGTGANNDIQSNETSDMSADGSVSLQATITNDDANVTVNGATTQLNASDDSFHKTVESQNGTTNIDISIKNGGSSNANGGLNVSTSSKIKINSSSSNSDDSSSQSYGDDSLRHERDR